MFDARRMSRPDPMQEARKRLHLQNTRDKAKRVRQAQEAAAHREQVEARERAHLERLSGIETPEEHRS